MSAPILRLAALQKPVFLVNSCLDLFTAGLSLDHPLFRSYGVIMPSSLNLVLSLTLGFSPRPPVVVCGTGTYKISLEAFLGSVASENFTVNCFTVTFQLNNNRIFLIINLYA